MIDINIVIPTFNEDENIISLLDNIKKNIPLAYITIVDDSKNNNIREILKKNNINKNIRYIHRINCRGRGSAVLYGFKKLLKKRINKYLLKWMRIFLISHQSLKKI